MRRFSPGARASRPSAVSRVGADRLGQPDVDSGEDADVLSKLPAASDRLTAEDEDLIACGDRCPHGI